MKLGWLKTNSAWQPFTFRGVAAFASASVKRLLLVQLIFAVLTAWTIAWFLSNAWFPTIRQAILQMPESGQLVSGKLDWTNEPPRLLAEGRFLAVIDDLNHTSEIRVPAHIQIELGRREVRFISLLGYADWPYPERIQPLDFNRISLEPWWGAWRPPILWTVSGAVFAGLMLAWWILSSLYCIPVWLIGFFSNRRMSLAGSWRLAGAALMPGALLMMLAIFAYGFGLLDPVQLIAAHAAHWVAGIVYCCVSVFFLPKLSTGGAPEKNPFQPRGEINASESPSTKSANPFKSSGK